MKEGLLATQHRVMIKCWHVFEGNADLSTAHPLSRERLASRRGSPACASQGAKLAALQAVVDPDSGRRQTNHVSESRYLTGLLASLPAGVATRDSGGLLLGYPARPGAVAPGAMGEAHRSPAAS